MPMIHGLHHPALGWTLFIVALFVVCSHGFIPIDNRDIGGGRIRFSQKVHTMQLAINDNEHDDYKDKACQASTGAKHIIFIRHGCTYMNEYLGKPGKAFGSPFFTDVFSESDQERYYRDSRLSLLGQTQVTEIAKSSTPAFLHEVDLFVCSPLTRALETFDLAFRPHLLTINKDLPVVALPFAAERLYLISDVGRPVSALKAEFPYVDFEQEMENVGDSVWWYDPNIRSQTASTVDDTDTLYSIPVYKEWRPTGFGQRYACPGEPADEFHTRMVALYDWLKQCPASNIAVVCHHGVIDWMLDVDFRNCEWRKVKFDDIDIRRHLAVMNR
jgi:broad specificity phosphatase PhoE